MRELDKFQGNWSLVSAQIDGEAVPEENLKEVRLKVRGHEFTEIIAGKRSRGRISLDANREPKWIDIRIFAGDNRGKRQHGIYTLEGDLLTACFTSLDKERPAVFVSEEGSDFVLEVWQRNPAPQPVKAEEPGSENLQA